MYWEAEEVRERLRTRMQRETDRIWSIFEDLDVSLRGAAYVHARRRIGEAVDARGSAERFQADADDG